jgi:hypothetical protein
VEELGKSLDARKSDTGYPKAKQINVAIKAILKDRKKTFKYSGSNICLK